MTTSRQRAQAHAKHAHFCSCGWVVAGNGARAAHRRKHQNANDGHHYWTRSEWERHGSPYLNHPIPDRRRPIAVPAKRG